MKQIIMTDEELTTTILECEDFANEQPARTKKKYIKELERASMPPATRKEIWGRLIATDVFKACIGDWEKVEGNCLYVND